MSSQPLRPLFLWREPNLVTGNDRVVGVKGPFIGGQASTVKTALERQTQLRMKAHNGCPFADWSRLGRAQKGRSWNVNSERKSNLLFSHLVCLPYCHLMEVQFWYNGLLAFYPRSILLLWLRDKTFLSQWLKLQKQSVNWCLLLIRLCSVFRRKDEKYRFSQSSFALTSLLPSDEARRLFCSNPFYGFRFFFRLVFWVVPGKFTWCTPQCSRDHL